MYSRSVPVLTSGGFRPRTTPAASNYGAERVECASIDLAWRGTSSGVRVASALLRSVFRCAAALLLHHARLPARNIGPVSDCRRRSCMLGLINSSTTTGSKLLLLCARTAIRSASCAATRQAFIGAAGCHSTAARVERVASPRNKLAAPRSGRRAQSTIDSVGRSCSVRQLAPHALWYTASLLLIRVGL